MCSQGCVKIVLKKYYYFGSFNLSNLLYTNLSYQYNSTSVRSCQCLGSLAANQSLELLSRYCRRDPYTIMDSLVTNETGTGLLQQVVPNKIRCGSFNPYTINIKDKCYCKTKFFKKVEESSKGKFLNK